MTDKNNKQIKSLAQLKEMDKETYLKIKRDEQSRVSKGVAKVLKDCKLNNWDMVAILEMLKTDIILNTNMVNIDGEALVPMKKNG